MPGVVREISLGEVSSPSDSGNENANFGDHPAQPRPKSGKAKTVLHGDPFSMADITKLEEFVHIEDLPELLMVYDKDNITNRCPHGPSREPLLYRRAYPKVLGNHLKINNPRRGFLFLGSTNAVASGRRSFVHRAPLVATLGPKGNERRRVAVVAKTANNTCRSHHLLRQEAKAYSSFPREFFTDAKRIPVDAPLTNRAPQPAMRPRGTFPGWAVAMRPKSSERGEVDPPIAPKFYGFYIPISPSGESLAQGHSSCKDFANSNCCVPRWAKSILLMEDCGEPIDTSSMLSKHREKCFDLVQRMHRQGFSHGHAHPRNIVAQPGPLSVPVTDRSSDTPSFRLISFGRWCGLAHPLPKETQVGAKRAFEKGRELDVCIAMDELRIGHDDGLDEDQTRSA